MVKIDPPPDHLRCHRTDGRQWRCKRPSIDGKKLCEVHHLQGQHRQNKEKVPESLKIQRKITKKAKKTRLKAKKRAEKALNVVPRKIEDVGASEALDGALKKMKLKRGDLHLELIREFLKRQVEKKKERELRKNDDKEERELPNGLMEISPGQNLDNANGFCNVKVGLDVNSIPTRRFRSKNIEPVPMGTMQVLPYARDIAKLKKKCKKKCHWCRKVGYCSLVQCSSCKREWFCKDCISERSATEEQVKIKCPVCLKTCECRSCLRSQSEDSKHKDLASEKNSIKKIPKLQYLILKLLPVLIQLNLEQRAELELEAKLKGGLLSELQIDQADSSCNKQYFCNNCQTSILDIHRSCKKCSYNLCLRCSDSSRGSIKAYLTECRDKNKLLKSGGKEPITKKIKKTATQDLGNNSVALKWEACDDNGNLICPPVHFGGCGDSSLSLRRVFPSGWTAEIQSRAEEILQNCDLRENLDDLDSCPTDNNKVIKASSRTKSEDNILYYPYADNLCGKSPVCFQKHWIKGHPVIVRSLMKRGRDISWDPIIMLCDYLEKTSARSRHNSTSKATDCLDWCEFEVCKKQIFMGSLEGRSHANMRDETTKIKLWISSSVFQEQFPDHYAEIIDALPLQDYMNPISSIFNLASNLPCDKDKPDVGPSMHISFGSQDDFLRAEFVTKLFCNPYDSVNILLHTTDVPISAEQLAKIKTSIKTYNTQDHRDMQNESEEKSSGEKSSEEKSSVVSGNSEESSFQNNMKEGEGLTLPNGDEEHDSESDSEPLIRWSESIVSSEESDGQKEFLRHDKSSYYLEDDRVPDSYGAEWDIFRREDVPKLVEYLSRHSYEFSQINGLPETIVHSIFDQCLYLDVIHKLKLKEEFNVEPWTFKQNLGEAVIVPAGCPYQIRCLKSCVNVVLDFISPENANKCINLIDERRVLPPEHKARKHLVEVKKITLDSIYAAVKEIQNL